MFIKIDKRLPKNEKWQFYIDKNINNIIHSMDRLRVIAIHPFEKHEKHEKHKDDRFRSITLETEDPKSRSQREFVSDDLGIYVTKDHDKLTFVNNSDHGFFYISELITWKE